MLSCVSIATCKANETMCKTTLYSQELGECAGPAAGIPLVLAGGRGRVRERETGR